MNRTDLIRTAWIKSQGADSRRLTECEWLLTNGLGGYGSGTISGIATRRYHGLLVAALPAPLGRMMMFNHLFEHLQLPDGKLTLLSGDGSSPTENLAAIGSNLSRFELDRGLPVWRYEIGAYVLERRLFMPHNANTVHVIYQLLEGPGPLRLRLRPGLHFRAHEASVGRPGEADYTAQIAGNRMEIHSADHLRLNMLLRDAGGPHTTNDPHFYDVEYSLEDERGYAHRDTLWSPGAFETELSVHQLVSLSASTESWDHLHSVEPAQALQVEFARRERLLERADPRARSGLAAELVLAADQFIIIPATRVADEARAKAAGDDVRSVIAGYHWFTDWGRDTMISLEGLTLSTGRWAEAGCTLRTFAQHVRDGLIPNFFLEGEQSGVYHTADATMWFFHALDRYLAYSNDRDTLRQLLPTLQHIIECHLRGTRFGIGIDPADGLFRQGEEGYQLTWMDAKVDDWVVTPRRGKPVEINALWFNALRLLAGWLNEEGQPVGSSRVDLQACKLEYSIVSPK